MGLFNKKLFRSCIAFLPFCIAIIFALLVGQGVIVTELQSSFLLLLAIVCLGHVLFFLAYDILGNAQGGFKLARIVLIVLAVLIIVACGILLFFAHLQIRSFAWLAAIYSSVLPAGGLSWLLYAKKVRYSSSKILSSFVPIISIIAVYCVNVLIVFLANLVNGFLGNNDFLYFIIHITFYVLPVIIILKAHSKPKVEPSTNGQEGQISDANSNDTYSSNKQTNEKEINDHKIGKEIEYAISKNFYPYGSICGTNYLNGVEVRTWGTYTGDGSIIVTCCFEHYHKITPNKELIQEDTIKQIEEITKNTLRKSEYATSVKNWEISLEICFKDRGF